MGGNHKMVKNQKGVTLTELLAYLAIMGIVAIILSSTLTYAVRTYNHVKGRGALNTEASNIMTKILTELNSLSIDYIEKCDNDEENVCVNLVNEKEWRINELGIIEEYIINEKTTLKINNGNIYLNDVKLNNENYYVEAYDIKNNEKIPNISYECNSLVISDRSYDFILNIRLIIYQINKNGEKISYPAVFENRFNYQGK